MFDSEKTFMSKIRLKIKKEPKLIMFLGTVIFSFLLTYLLRGSYFSSNQNYVLFILLAAIGFWITESIPPFSVGILIIGYLVFTLGQTPDFDVTKYVHTWSDCIIWLFLGGFFLAEAMKKTKLDELLLQVILPKFGNKPPNILLGVMSITMLLSSLMSNTATTSMILATISPLLITLGKNSKLSKALLVGVPAAASMGGMATIVGSAPNAIAVGALNAVGYKISFFDWMAIGVPVAFSLNYLFYFYLVRSYELYSSKYILNHNELKNNSSNFSKKNDKIQRVIVLFILTITLLLWLFSKTVKIPIAATSGIPIIIFTMLGIINADDVKKLPWDILMLVAGGLALGMAVQEQGIVQHFVNQIKHFNFNYYFLLFFFGFLTVIFSNFMSNTAASTILTPVATTLLSLIPGINPMILPIVISLCASCALLLPVSTPPNAMAYSYGILEQKDFVKGGFLMILTAPIIIIVWCLIYSSLFN